MKKPFFGILVLTTLGLAVSANAQDPNHSDVSWTYVEGGLATFKPDGRSDQTGLFGGGSIGSRVIPMHIFAEIGNLDKIDTIQFGAGWHGLLGPKADLFADVSYYDVDYDDGLRIRFGARWMVTEELELNGYLAWTDLDLTTNNSITVNGVYSLTKRFSLGGGFEWGNEFRTARLFARYNFGDVF